LGSHDISDIRDGAGLVCELFAAGLLTILNAGSGWVGEAPRTLELRQYRSVTFAMGSMHCQSQVATSIQLEWLPKTNTMAASIKSKLINSDQSHNNTKLPTGFAAS